SKWSPHGRWPVLIEGDGMFAGMFIRRFHPADVYRRESIAAPQTAKIPDPQSIQRAVVNAWGGNPAESIPAAFKRAGFIPQGVIYLSTADPAWTAGVALAAGRGEPIAWLDGDFSNPNGELDSNASRSLMQTVDDLAQSTGYSWSQLGDDIDTITICRNIAGRFRVQLPGQSANVTDPIAMTDVLGRTNQGSRWAMCGWIFGDEVQSAYIAMCSLFLDRENVALLNGHPIQPGWDQFAAEKAAEILQPRGFHTTQAGGDQMLLAAWQQRNAFGLTADVTVLNSKGNWDWFHLYKDQVGYAEDIPVLNVPTALHMIHSFSLRYPEDESTIGCRFIKHGVYAYVGSMWEPMLSAFVPPKNLAERWVNCVPFLIAARMWDEQGQAGTAWRIQTIGDPLMLCIEPAKIKKTRIANPTKPDGVNVLARAKSLMQECQKSGDSRAFGEAVRDLVLVDQDQIAIALWKISLKRDLADSSSRFVLGALFRAQDRENFIRAWKESGTSNLIARDMLWSMFTPNLAGFIDRDAVQILASNLRGPDYFIDAQRILPIAKSTLGPAGARMMLQRQLESMQPSAYRQKIADLLAVFK
ncbi:MAG TPA: hypothetical protein VG711_03720, partial [Phycisphaerales bacterium]|nr:hypothetical protein [Phycisphaerales bacterium]